MGEKKERSFLRTRELMEMLGVSRTTVYKLRSQGMPFIKLNGIVLYEADAVSDFIRGRGGK